MTYIKEDFERVSELDKMYIWELESEMFQEYIEKLPAKIIIKNKKSDGKIIRRIKNKNH